MVQYKLDTPVVLLIFNRPDTTARVFARIAQAKPPKLLVVADGPRLGHADDRQLCAAARAVVERVDWDCDVLTDYADRNLGLRARVSSGLNWAFEQIDDAIILEDDCVPHPAFFRFCEELLYRYRQDRRIMVVSGTNYQFGRNGTPYSYYHSIYNHCWGWATWQRAWQHYDEEMTLWPYVRDHRLLASMFEQPKAMRYWMKRFQDVYDDKIQSWAYRWTLSCWLQSGLTLLPHANLVSNIGFGGNASNTLGRRSPLANMKTDAIQFPLQHPPYTLQHKQADIYTQQTLYRNNVLAPFKRELKKLLTRNAFIGKRIQ